MSKINLRFLVVVLIALVVVGVAGYFLHRYQIQRNHSAYLIQFTRAEEEKKFDRAGRLLRAYVLAVPSDTDARVRYGEFLEQHGKTPKDKSLALSVYEQALNQAPDHHPARHRAAELCVTLGRHDAALAHLAKLVIATPDDGRVLFLTGFCQEAKKRYPEAIESYTRSGKVAPTPEAFVRRAGVQRIYLKQTDGRQEDGTETGPQAALNELVAALPNSYEAYLARAAYHKTYTAADGYARARKDLERARELAPDEPAVLLASARVAIELANRPTPATPDGRTSRERLLSEARGYLEHGLAKSPKASALYLALSEVEQLAGRRKEAMGILERGRERVPEPELPEVLFVLGGMYAEAGDKAGTDSTVARLVKLKQDGSRIDLFRGESLVRQGLWYEGSGVLEKVRPLMAKDPAKTVHIDLLLARCYGELGDVDRQLLAYNRAKLSDAADVRPRLGLAAVKAALGRTAEAIEEYEVVTRGERSPAAAWLSLARLMVYRNLTLPLASRRWDEVGEKLAAVARVAPEAVELSVLEAEVLMAKGDVAGATARLTAARDARPKEPELWFALAVLTDRAGKNKEAHALLDEAAKTLGDTADLRNTRLRVMEYTSPEQAAAALDKLADGADRFPPDDRVRLLRSLGAANWRIDRPVVAAKLWDQLATLRPSELAVRLLRFDAALRLNDDDGMKRTLGDIRRIEGGGPNEKYGSAIRLTWLAGRGDRSGLAEARALLAVASARRPGWARVPLALARIDEIEGNTDLALEHLKQAVELGDRQMSVVKRVAQLLDERGRGKEADDLLRRLEAQAPISNDLQRLAAEVSLRLDVDRAVDLAQKAVAADSQDYREQVWLGRMLSAGGKAKAAETQFEVAVKTAPDRPEVWVAALHHAVRRQDADPTRTAKWLERADAALGGKEPLALAVCYELTGKWEEAEKRYVTAVQTTPADVKGVRAIAAFYLQSGTPAKAEPFLRRLVGGDVKASTDDLRWARRNLALAVGIRSNAEGHAEANRLLDTNAAEGENPDDLRTRAILSATRGGKRAEVITLLEKAERLKPPQPEHEFLLARLYEAEGDWRKSRERLLRLVSSQKDNGVYMRFYAGTLIRRGDFADAEVWVNRLVEARPNALTTLTLQVQLLCRMGKADKALAVLRKHRDTPSDTATDSPYSLALADLFELAAVAGAGQDASGEAEKLFAEYRTQGKRPDAGLPLAGYYGRTDEPQKALDLCEEALRAGCPLDRVALAGLSATSGARTETGHFAVVEEWLTKALGQKVDSPDLRFLLGALREQQQRYDDAEAEYRKVLAKAPTHAGALNNLAYLQAVRGLGADAVRTAAGAVTAAGDPPPDLLDTRGVAYAAAGDLLAARKDLEAAAHVGGVPVAYFHLAVVMAGQKDSKAKVTLQQAAFAGMRPSHLHPLERERYARLRKELGLDR